MKPHEIELIKFFEFAKFQDGDKVWDFGCGEGRFIAPLKQEGCEVWATDKDRGIAPKEKMDKFLLACVLHYNIGKAWILWLAYTWLKPGGSIVIIEPNPYNPFFYALYFWRWLTKSKCPRRWYNEKFMLTDKRLVNILKNTGFKNIKVQKYAWLPSKFGWLRLNTILNKIPLINKMNAFNWVRAER